MIALLGIVATARAMIWLAPDSQRTSDGTPARTRETGAMPTTCSCSAQPWSGDWPGVPRASSATGLPQAADLRRRGAVRAVRDRSTSLLRHCMRVELTSATARRPTPRRSTIGGPVVRDSLFLILSTARLVAAFRSTPLGRPPTTPSPQGIGAREAIGATVAPQPRQPQDSAPARPRPSASLAADTRRRLHIFLSRHRGCHVMISLTRGPRRARVRAATEEEVPSMTGHASAPEDRPPVS